MTLRLDWCSWQAARLACKRWHYSGSLPTPPLVRVGVWEHGVFIGAVVFSRGNSMYMGTAYGVDQTGVAELSRVALREHDAPVTKIVSLAVRFLRRSNPGLRVLISYADPGHGHHGGIYQAGNWIYLGQMQPSVLYRDRAGRVWHSRMTSPLGVKKQYGTYRRVVRPEDCERIDTPGKHKYALPLDRAMRATLEPLAQPYPSRLPVARAGGVDGDAAADQAEEGGSIPTSALHDPL